MMMFEFVQFVKHIQKAYTFTDLKEYYSCQYIGTKNLDLYTHSNVYLSGNMGKLLILFLPTPEIEPRSPAWLESALTTRLCCERVPQNSVKTSCLTFLLFQTYRCFSTSLLLN